MRSIWFMEALQRGVYFLAPQYDPVYPPGTGLFRFDPNTSKLDRVELPGKALPIALERTEDGLLVQTRDSGAFLLTAEGQPWVAVPKAYRNDVRSEEHTSELQSRSDL